MGTNIKSRAEDLEHESNKLPKKEMEKMERSGEDEEAVKKNEGDDTLYNKTNLVQKEQASGKNKEKVKVVKETKHSKSKLDKIKAKADKVVKPVKKLKNKTKLKKKDRAMAGKQTDISQILKDNDPNMKDTPSTSKAKSKQLEEIVGEKEENETLRKVKTWDEGVIEKVKETFKTVAQTTAESAKAFQSKAIEVTTELFTDKSSQARQVEHEISQHKDNLPIQKPKENIAEGEADIENQVHRMEWERGFGGKDTEGQDTHIEPRRKSPGEALSSYTEKVFGSVKEKLYGKKEQYPDVAKDLPEDQKPPSEKQREAYNRDFQEKIERVETGKTKAPGIPFENLEEKPNPIVQDVRSGKLDPKEAQAQMRKQVEIAAANEGGMIPKDLTDNSKRLKEQQHDKDTQDTSKSYKQGKETVKGTSQNKISRTSQMKPSKPWVLTKTSSSHLQLKQRNTFKINLRAH
jgi:hypothetical protein